MITDVLAKHAVGDAQAVAQQAASVVLQRAAAAEEPRARAELQRDHAEERPAGRVDAGVGEGRPRLVRVQERVQPHARDAVHGECCSAHTPCALPKGHCDLSALPHSAKGLFLKLRLLCPWHAHAIAHTQCHRAYVQNMEAHVTVWSTMSAWYGRSLP